MDEDFVLSAGDSVGGTRIERLVGAIVAIFAAKGTFFDYIVNNTDPAYVSFELDILWAFHPGADPAALLKKYGPRFKLMHVKDLRKGVVGDFSGSTSVENDVALGTGQIDVANVIEAAKKSAIEHYYIEDESSSVSVQVPQSLKFLKSL